MRQFLILCFVCLFLFSYSSLSLANSEIKVNTKQKFEQPKYLKSKDAFILSYEKKDRIITLQWSIAPNYYLYKNSISITSSDNRDLFFSKPPGIKYNDPTFGYVNVYKEKISFPVYLSNINSNTLLVSYQGCNIHGFCYPPQTKTIELNPSISDNYQNILSQWFSPFMFLVFGIGLAFTPCIFPMYPITTKILSFHEQKPKKTIINAIIYLQGIAVIYSIFGFITSLVGLKVQFIFQSPLFLITACIILILLGLSMMFQFQIIGSSKLNNFINQLSFSLRFKSNYLNSFFLGILAGILCTPCTTAPLSAVLIYSTQANNPLWTSINLYLLATGMTLPLLVFILVGKKHFPKSGAWLNSIKQLLGLILLTLPIMIIQPIINPYIIKILWFIWASCLFLFILKKFNFTLKSSLFLVFITIVITIAYLNFKPQKTTQLNFLNLSTQSEIDKQIISPANKDKLIMIDFYADWCSACRKLEHTTFVNPKVINAMLGMQKIRVDLSELNEENLKIMQKMNIIGLPTILFIKNNTILKKHTITGFISANLMVDHINSMTSQ
ncbi:hypothetical protein CF386_04015 [Paraphotobacterium marinum]|uniref:Thioredoxin domain-containing protein n=1 Tax=Paraphotobacterium marinum TaxID=1755811 RepID=A0A220VCW8_9GAMM|nr:protein-disulfide reductase DsbD [Paraphotobacterium marinum]ASK78248.1 hypothetical protein CF386_04015 [Paraphotobacterium marinum]